MTPRCQRVCLLAYASAGDIRRGCGRDRGPEHEWDDAHSTEAAAATQGAAAVNSVLAKKKHQCCSRSDGIAKIPLSGATPNHEHIPSVYITCECCTNQPCNKAVQQWVNKRHALGQRSLLAGSQSQRGKCPSALPFLPHSRPLRTDAYCNGIKSQTGNLPPYMGEEYRSGS